MTDKNSLLAISNLISQIEKNYIQNQKITNQLYSNQKKKKWDQKTAFDRDIEEKLRDLNKQLDYQLFISQLFQKFLEKEKQSILQQEEKDQSNQDESFMNSHSDFFIDIQNFQNSQNDIASSQVLKNDEDQNFYHY